MNRLKIVTVCGTALLLAAAVAVVVALRNRQQPAPPSDVPVAVSPAEVRVKAVERKPEPSDHEVVEASTAVAVVCGADVTTADRYEARNDALGSISRRTDLPNGDVAALMAYLRAQDGALRAERVAALKNDVMNLLRNQDPLVEGLVETLIAMIEGGNSDCGGALGDRALPGNTIHPPVVVDYCIQHLGAMVNELGDARRSAAVDAAIKRIKGREDIGTPTAGKEASLTLRPLLRAVQPHEIRSDSFGGLGAVPPDKESRVGGNNRGFATRS